jgi:hypothetical protein
LKIATSKGAAFEGSFSTVTVRVAHCGQRNILSDFDVRRFPMPCVRAKHLISTALS